MSDLPLHRTMQDDEIDRLKAQLKEAEEKGRVLMDMCRDLKARVAELEEGLRGITKYPDVREYVGTICHDAALSALKGSGGAWLLRKQAGAAEEAIVCALRTVGNVDPFEVNIHKFANDYARRLRQQADEAERAGGEK